MLTENVASDLIAVRLLQNFREPRVSIQGGGRMQAGTHQMYF